MTVSIKSPFRLMRKQQHPDPDQPFFTVSITVNGQPIFLNGIAVFNVVNRSSSAYVVQATLAAGDLVGASALQIPSSLVMLTAP